VKLPNIQDILEALSKFLDEVNLGNSYLFVGIFATLISVYLKPEDVTIGLKIGMVTLIFGGIFRLLNIVTRPLKDKEKDEKTNQETKIWFKWNDVARFTIWVLPLMVYLVWIDKIISVLTPDSFKCYPIIFSACLVVASLVLWFKQK